MEPRHPLAMRLSALALMLSALVLMLALAGQAGAATIEIKGKTNKGLRFSEPKPIERGENLKIENDTDPRKVGPHSFTLARQKDLPSSNKEGRKCFDRGNLCATVAEAHEVDFETEEIGKRKVEEGKAGWDVEFTTKDFGDSFFFFEEGESHKREIRAKAGEKLGFFCVIHPQMQGELKVAE